MQIAKVKCEKCGHIRVIRTENPVKCSRCGHIPGTKIKTKKAEALIGEAGLTKAESDFYVDIILNGHKYAKENRRRRIHKLLQNHDFSNRGNLT